MKKLIIALNSETLSLNQRAAQLDQGLKQLPAERAPVDALIEQKLVQITQMKNDLLNLLK